MTTDSGLVYLSGLLRAGAEPLSPAARAERRRAARPTHAARVSGDSEDDDAWQSTHAAPGHASDDDAPAGVADAERAEAAVAVKSSEAAGDPFAPSTDVSLGESAVESLPDDSDDVNDLAEGVEQHAHAQIQSRAVPPSSRGVRAASAMNVESHTPAASPTAPFAGAARTRPADERHGPGLRADELHGGETERTAVVTEQTPTEAGEGELIPATRSPLDVRPPATLHGEPNDSAVTQSETFSTVEGSPRRESKAKPAEEVLKKKAKPAGEVLKKADEESAAHGASSVLSGASSVRGSSARRDTPARASQASREEGSPTFAGDRARVSEGVAEQADASAGTSADSAPFTLEAHVEHLRALMQTARAEAPDEEHVAGALRPPAVIASHRTPSLTTAAHSARAQPRTEQRPEVEARPETPTPAAKSVERQPVALVNPVERQPAVPVNQEPPVASSGHKTLATEARPATPRAAWARPGGVSPARVRGEETPPAQPAQATQSAHVRTADAPSVTQDSAPAVATTLARVGPAPTREGGSAGPAAAAGGGRAPKLTINRLDVQVVRPHEPPPDPPPPSEPPASESPPRAADPWGALDRQLLGRFSY